MRLISAIITGAVLLSFPSPKQGKETKKKHPAKKEATKPQQAEFPDNYLPIPLIR